MGAPPTGQSTNNPVTAMSDFSSLGIFNTWGRIDPNGTVSFLPLTCVTLQATGRADDISRGLVLIHCFLVTLSRIQVQREPVELQQ